MLLLFLHHQHLFSSNLLNITMSSNNNSSKRVRFTQETQVEYTYSQDDYDRSWLATMIPSSSSSSSSTSTCSKVTRDRTSTRPISARQRPYIPPLDLSGVPNACGGTPVTDHTVAVTIVPPATAADDDTKKQKQHQHQRPAKLFIDTQSIRDAPLFFSHMSTYYTCRSDDDCDKDIFWTPTTSSSPACY